MLEFLLLLPYVTIDSKKWKKIVLLCSWKTVNTDKIIYNIYLTKELGQTSRIDRQMQNIHRVPNDSDSDIAYLTQKHS